MVYIGRFEKCLRFFETLMAKDLPKIVCLIERCFGCQTDDEKLDVIFNNVDSFPSHLFFML